MQKRVWLITGCSSGFGKILSEQILARGDQLIATARNPNSIEFLRDKTKSDDQLLILKLDVNSKSDIQSAIEKAHSHFGRIDVLINNAGYGQIGALEEVSDSEIRKSFDTNVFGLIEVTRAILPIMRAQKSGHIMNMSSVAGIAALAGAGIYAATKFAVEGISEALAGEVAPFNIKVTLIEPGAFRTEFASGSLKTAPEMKEYDQGLTSTRTLYKNIGGNQPGDPAKAASAMINLVDHPHPPLRLVMGALGLKRVRAKMESYEKELSAWESTTLAMDFESPDQQS